MKRHILPRIAMLLSAGLSLLYLFGRSSTQEFGSIIDDRLVSAYTRFSFKTFQRLVGSDRSDNVFISPTSVAMALALAYNGAQGETQQAMARVLELQGLSLTETNHANAQLKSVLEIPDSKVQLLIANSLWDRKGIQFKPEFIDANKKFYGAQITELDFNLPHAGSIINEWVRTQTRGKIDTIVDDIDRRTVLFLINAIYFKGAWTAEFDKTKTKEDLFYLAKKAADDVSGRALPILSG